MGYHWWNWLTIGQHWQALLASAGNFFQLISNNSILRWPLTTNCIGSPMPRFGIAKSVSVSYRYWLSTTFSTTEGPRLRMNPYEWNKSNLFGFFLTNRTHKMGNLKTGVHLSIVLRIREDLLDNNNNNNKPFIDLKCTYYTRMAAQCK
jgi:hypothetical protein